MDRVVVVTKPTRLEELIREHLTEGMAQFILETKGDSIAPYRDEHTTYQDALITVRRQIPNDLAVTTVSRNDLPTFLFRDDDLVIVCGPDGLFVNLAQYVTNQLVLGINPDPSSIIGNLMPFGPTQVGDVITRVKNGKYLVEDLPFVKATTSDDKVVWGINDIFIGRRDHISARYKIAFGSREERHSSDGVIVSTGVGTNGWLRSIVAMVDGLIPERGRHLLTQLPGPTDLELVFVVRDPFPSPVTGATIVTGRVVVGSLLKLTSEMPRGGVIFSDGIIEKGVDWPAGSTVTVTVGERVVHRVV
ncbi:MAG: sugar kinase [Patescibacteria group bacterium]